MNPVTIEHAGAKNASYDFKKAPNQTVYSPWILNYNLAFYPKYCLPVLLWILQMVSGEFGFLFYKITIRKGVQFLKARISPESHMKTPQFRTLRFFICKSLERKGESSLTFTRERVPQWLSPRKEAWPNFTPREIRTQDCVRTGWAICAWKRSEGIHRAQPCLMKTSHANRLQLSWVL